MHWRTYPLLLGDKDPDRLGVRMKRVPVKLTTIRSKFLAISLPIGLAAMLVLFFLFELQAFRLAHRELHEKLDKLVTAQSTILAESVWNVDDERTGLILSSLIADPDVAGIAVHDETDGVIRSFGDLPKSVNTEEFKHDHSNKFSEPTFYSDVRDVFAAITNIRPHPHDDMVAIQGIFFETDASKELIGHLVVRFTLNNVLAATRKRLLWDGLLAAALVLAVIVSTVVAHGRTVGTPLQRFLRVINRAKIDQRPALVDWQSSDEIGAVVIAFNDLQKSLTEHEVALRRSRDELEEQVRVRTQELREANNELRVGSQALAKSERKFRTLASNVPGAVYRCANDPDHTVIYISEDIQDLCGHLPSVFLEGRLGWDDIIHTEDLDRVKTTSDKAAQADVPMDIEYRMYRRDGTECWVWERSIHERDSQSEIVGFAGVILDISDRKKIEQQLVHARRTAEQANQAKSRFLAMMSHEIRTPLNGVLGILNLLRDTRLNDDQRELLKTARDSGKSLLTIINDILDYSKLEAGRMVFDREAFLVTGLIDTVCELTRPLADSKHVSLTSTLSDTVPQACFGDQGRIRQVLLNLTSNAVKFTEAGKIHIEANAKNTGGDLVDVTLSVTDTGIGVEEDKKDLIFSEFSSLEKEVSGDLGSTGLGLAISKFIVEAMGGRIGCESTRGSGSTFWFTVPLMQADPHEIRHDTGDEIVPSDGLQKLRILLAEDNATNQMVLTRMLEGMGCRVDVAGNGQEAVEAASSRRYHAILMDIGMPEMDGVAAARVIRGMEGSNRNIPIIALTAYAYSEECQRIKSAGIGEVITKPVSQRELIAALEQIAANTNVAGAETAPTHVLDRSVLDSLLKDRDSANKRQLIQQIFDDLQAQRSALSVAVATQDLDLLERASHTLEGLGGVFGGCALSEQAHEANTHAKNAEMEAAWTSANSLASDCDKVLERVEKLLKCSLGTLDKKRRADVRTN